MPAAPAYPSKGAPAPATSKGWTPYGGKGKPQYPYGKGKGKPTNEIAQPSFGYGPVPHYAPEWSQHEQFHQQPDAHVDPAQQAFGGEAIEEVGWSVQVSRARSKADMRRHKAAAPNSQCTQENRCLEQLCTACE